MRIPTAEFHVSQIRVLSGIRSDEGSEIVIFVLELDAPPLGARHPAGIPGLHIVAQAVGWLLSPACLTCPAAALFHNFNFLRARELRVTEEGDEVRLAGEKGVTRSELLNQLSFRTPIPAIRQRHLIANLGLDLWSLIHGTNVIFPVCACRFAISPTNDTSFASSQPETRRETLRDEPSYLFSSRPGRGVSGTSLQTADWTPWFFAVKYVRVGAEEENIIRWARNLGR
ncbi:hypothetical protein Moror_4338 [Moniliophthora roreri MCA 2997]|uniref:Uncharacterized protein n=2 Tax=Moniliophthora roreri TaxID=221103 RepID=V2XJI0_MONRO|nr:hypothetical protein Moror_4338 [Moniliophthora roreri MCA 2997]